jgi:hypothetical protein
MQHYARLSAMVDEFNRYFDDSRRSLSQYLADPVEQFPCLPPIDPLLAVPWASTSRICRAGSRRRRS